MVKDKIKAIGRVAALIVMMITIVVIVAAFIRSRRQTRPPGPVRAASAMKANVTSVVEGYQTVRTENGRETLRLLAAKDIAYSDGRHELEKVDLTAFGEPLPGQGPKTTRIVADRGAYLPGQSLVTFEGNVTVTSSDGLVVTTQSLNYEQQTQVASSDVAIQFRQGDLQGSAVGAQLFAKTRQLTLLREAYLISTRNDPPSANRLPIEIRGEKAGYDETQGVLRFEGQANAKQGERTAQADLMVGRLDPATKKLARIELRGQSQLKSIADRNVSEIIAREMDFLLDGDEHLKSSVARGSARAFSLKDGSPREILAEQIEVQYQVQQNRSLPQKVMTEGRTTIRLEAPGEAGTVASISERVLEADGVQATFREDGQTFAEILARGNAALTVTPRPVTPKAERKRLKADQFLVTFAEAANRIRDFQADGKAWAEFEPLSPGSQRQKRTISGKKLTAQFQEETQDVAEAVMEGGVKFTEGDRTAVAARATYAAGAQAVALRGKPQLWDSSARADAEEIDANLDSGESLLRGRVRTTYFSRETTGGAAPFKNRQAPVTVASDNAVVRHREGAARYLGNARAWQEDEFVRADQLEIDRGERSLLALGHAQSAYYQLEREVEKGKKQIVPVFATADRISYNDGSRRTFYEGAVRIRQGTDLLEAASAEALMDDDHRLVEITATTDVIMTQPDRRARGEKMVYIVKDDTATMTGSPAVLEDRQSDLVTKSEKLTLHLGDARIEANSNGGGKKRVKTTHRIQ